MCDAFALLDAAVLDVGVVAHVARAFGSAVEVGAYPVGFDGLFQLFHLRVDVNLIDVNRSHVLRLGTNTFGLWLVACHLSYFDLDVGEVVVRIDE